MKAKMRVLLAVLLLAAFAGCGRELVVGGQKEVEAVAAGDEGTGGTASLAAPGGVAPAAAYTVVLPEGTVTFVASLALVTEDGGVVPLTQAAHTVRVRIGERESIVRDLVPAVRYARVRVVFTDVTAEIASGLPGVSGTVRVAMPGGSVVVDRPVPLTDPGRPETLLVDLNASAWLVAAVGGVVPAATFEGAVRIRAL